jgi:DnaD/phage-associated family protein
MAVKTWMAYIGIDRDIEDHWIFKDAEYFKVWFEILLRTRFSKEPERKLIEGKLITIEYGQFIFGRVSWSERLGISEQRLRTLIKKLLKDEMIELVKVYQKCSIYFVKNYAKYNHQSNHQQNQQQKDNTDDANHQNNRASTTNQPSANHQLTTQEESKELNHLNHLKDITTTTIYNAYRLYESERFGLISSTIGDKIGFMIDDFTELWVCKAMEEAVYYGKKYLPYVDKVLKEWKLTGHSEPWTLERKEQPQPQKNNVRHFNRGGMSGKQHIPIAEKDAKSAPLSAEKRAELQRMAELLDGDSTGTDRR